MSRPRICIIGAGMAGIACASLLSKHGISAVILEKSRGVGGRLATRRTESGPRFDHGAQFVTANDPSFRAALDGLREVCAVAAWNTGERDVIVGVPSMNTLAKHLAAGLAVERHFHATNVVRIETGWQIETADKRLECDRLVMTAPAPQAAALLGVGHPLADEIRHVRMSPCWTLMAAVPASRTDQFTGRRDPDHALQWIALDSSKPGRDNANCWVAQAAADWSTQNLERDKEDVGDELLAKLCGVLGCELHAVTYHAAHRWRYAKVETPLGKPFVRNEDATLYLGGDWCLGARVEAAWTSGIAIATDLLERLDAS